MRYAAFSTIPVKEVSVVGPDAGDALHRSRLAAWRALDVSSELFVGAAGYRLDIIALPTGERMVRLRRQVGSGPNGIAALGPDDAVPSAGLDARRSVQRLRADHDPAGNDHRRSRRRKPHEAAGADFLAVTEVRKFGFDVEIVTSRARIAADHADLKWFGSLGAGLLLIAATGIVVLVPRRTARNPMAEIEHALEAGEFVPYYQPIVDIRTGRLCGAEVLVRWRKPDGTLVLPGAFIPLMGSSDLIHDLDP